MKKSIKSTESFMTLKKSCLAGMVGVIIIYLGSPGFSQTSAGFQLKKSSISNGGGVVNSGNFKLKESALGGLSVGKSSSSGFVLNGGMLITNIQDSARAKAALPKMFRLQQNYPNPFNPTTTIQYDLPKTSKVTINIFNAVGQLVRKLNRETQQPGSYQLTWDGRDQQGQLLPSGVYLYQIAAVGFTDVKKMLLVK
ncbi:MAG: FlgD immunoglobulin-like domain containing protein [Methanosarcinaceae archaeon]